MKHFTFRLILVFALFAGICQIFAQGTLFTYQGRLNNGIDSPNGSYDFQFYLRDASSGGNPVGVTNNIGGVGVSNGLFTVTLDFGNQFPGADRWLEIGVRTNGAVSFTTLVPRQKLTPTPYAIFANTASNLTGTISAANLSGTYGNTVSFTNSGDSFTGNGSGLSSLNASQLTSGTVPVTVLSNAWKTTGNAGTMPGVNFVGTSDNQPLEIHVNGARAFRFEPTATNGAVNVIGGSPNNYVAGGVVGATIGGGGAVDFSGASYTNSVTVNFGTVGGGYANNANGYAAAVSGGYNNANNGFAGFIGAGAGNTIVGNGGGDGAFLGGGYSNTNGGEAATIGGGTANFIGTFANNAFIGGGGENSIVGSYVLPVFDTISGGQNNSIQTNAIYATIGGGIGNTVQSNVLCAVVGGGSNNVIQSSSAFASIGGGYNNANAGYASTISGGYNNSNAGFASTIGGGEGHYLAGDGAVIGGGYFNTNTGSAATVGGGQYNVIIGAADHATIAGGGGNNITGSDALPVFCTIGGGENNSILTNTSFATIGGGITNVIRSGAHNAVISGGNGNVVLNAGQFSTIGGGVNNANFAPFATIPGGVGNAAGANAFAAGSGAQALNQGSFVWADSSSSSAFSSTNNNSFNIRAAGGVRIATTSSGAVGALLAAGATSWSTLSDRNAKKNFAPMNYEAVLEKLVRVPIEQWNYKWEKDGDAPNIGPMAQDFKAAFYPGRDDKSISTLEFDGVELAAIQGLNQKLEQKETEITELKVQVAELKVLVKQLAQEQQN